MAASGIVLAACLFACPAVVPAEPGVALSIAGVQVADLRVSPPTVRRRAAVTNVPGIDNRTSATLQRTRGDFELTREMAPDGSGVCQVWVAGKTFRGDHYGGLVQAAFNATVAQLAVSYGPPNQLIDDLRPGADYFRPNEWLRSIFRAERTFQAQWTPPASAPLVDNVTAITVTVRTRSEADSYLTVQYKFGNTPACRAVAAL